MRTRLFVVAAAVIAAVLLWLLAAVVGFDLRPPAMGDAPNQPLDLFGVVFITLVAALAGWVTLATLEALTGRGRAIWTGLAIVVLLASLAAPLSGHGVSAADRVWLAVMHFAVAAVLVPGLLAHRPTRQPLWGRNPPAWRRTPRTERLLRTVSAGDVRNRSEIPR